MSALRAWGLRLAAVGTLALAPLPAQATLHLVGPSDWYRGQPISIELVADADTMVNTFFFETVGYGAFASVLALASDPTATLPPDLANGGACNPWVACSFAYYPPRSVSKDTVVARWDFLVKDDATLGPVSFDFDLVIEADTGDFDLPEWIKWPETKQFQVLAVPEASSWIVMLVGLAVLGAGAYRRRIGA